MTQKRIVVCVRESERGERIYIIVMHTYPINVYFLEDFIYDAFDLAFF